MLFKLEAPHEISVSLSLHHLFFNASLLALPRNLLLMVDDDDDGGYGEGEEIGDDRVRGRVLKMG